jgi:porin
MRRLPTTAWVLAALLSSSVPAHDFELGQVRLAVGGVIAGTVQCDRDGCGAAAPAQPQLGARFAGGHEVVVRFGFASGDGLNVDSGFEIPPWAADLESTVRNVNGRNRDHLLIARYTYSAALRDESRLSVSAGIIDATDYLDQNAYSNDEYTQFLNGALVNGPNIFLPSYDRGVALGWEGKHWSASGVYMSVGQADVDTSLDFLGVQVGYRLDTRLGEGNYRLLVDGIDRPSAQLEGTLERREALLISCDQQLGSTVGVFLRVASQTESIPATYTALYSVGVDLRGAAWGRERDNVAVAYAYAGGGNRGLERSQVFEAYYRVVWNRFLALTVDLQQMRDQRDDDRPGQRGFIAGLRLVASF